MDVLSNLAGSILVALLAAGSLVGQGSATGAEAKKPQAMAKDADPDWEVVTVKPSDPNATNAKFDRRGRQLIVENHTLETMLMFGYGLQKNQIAGAPDWVRSERFDVDGAPDVEGQPTIQQFQGLIRKLLTERFGLKAHKEQREMPVFALRVGKDGPKFTATKSEPGTTPNQQVNNGPGYRALRFTNYSMPQLALMMLVYVDRPVVDQTGLTGQYDFNLSFTYDETRAPTDGTAPPSLFTAIQEQMGLKLEPVKAPAEVLVVDAVEKPSAN